MEEECPVCTGDEVLITLGCGHAFCEDCVQTSFVSDVSNGKVPLQCLQCEESVAHAIVNKVLQDVPEVLEKHEKFSLLRMLQRDPLVRFCPKPGCKNAVVCAPNMADCPRIVCTECNTSHCFKCRDVWHGTEPCNKGLKQEGSLKSCPKCAVPIAKANDGRCNTIQCSICRTEFCWLCLKELNSLESITHFTSLSGCTMFGKKRWSDRKKRNFRRSSPLTVPVAIAGAAIMVPISVLSLPVFVMKDEWHAGKERNEGKAKRIAKTSGAVLGSLIITPPAVGLLFSAVVIRMTAFAYFQMPYQEIKKALKKKPKTAQATTV